MSKTQTLYQDPNSPMRQIVDIDGYQLAFDVPETLGGEASAPNPHVYFDASIIACKAMTIKIYANRKGYDLRDLKIHLNRDDSQERKGVYKMDIGIELIGDLDDEARQALLSIAEQCPVGKLVTDAVDVQIHSHLV